MNIARVEKGTRLITEEVMPGNCWNHFSGQMICVVPKRTLYTNHIKMLVEQLGKTIKNRRKS
jgi:hypothetical protein